MKAISLRSIRYLAYLSPFFERLAAIPNNLETLEIQYLENAEIDWAHFESILLQPSFSQLYQLNCPICGPFQRKDVYSSEDSPEPGSPADVNMVQRMEALKQNLPRLYSKGVLRLWPVWRCVSTQLLNFFNTADGAVLKGFRTLVTFGLS